MITATFFATDNDGVVLLASGYDEEKDIFGRYPDTNELRKNIPIFNYASFMGNGIDMYDNSVELGSESDYYGFIGNLPDLGLLPTKEGSTMQAGISIIFDRFSCKKIEIYHSMGGERFLLASAEDEDGLPLITHIPFSLELRDVESATIEFSGFPDNAYMTIKGIVFGKIIDINDFFSFDSVSEIRPLGDDLPLNEINSDVYVTEDFFTEEGQTIKYYDNGIMENGILTSSENTYKDRYSLKSRNLIQLLNEGEEFYNVAFRETVDDWNLKTPTASGALSKIGYNNEIEYSYPDYFSSYVLSPYLPIVSGRKALQQIAWATCCAIDTSYKDKIVFVPFLASEIREPDIVIANDDGRILESKITKGERYSTVVWEYTEYIKNPQLQELGKIEAKYIGYSGDFGSYAGSLSLSEPFAIYDFSGATYSAETLTPFYLDAAFDYENTYTVRGYKYDAYKRQEIIDTGIRNGKTLTISNQTIYPIDKTQKIEQLRKWYSMNNTVSATVVDDGDIRLGKTIQLQLANGSFFTGIITKVERSNISDYHTVRLEAHEWHT